jgi:glycosyltransferase involved in cell wall biosynthesis
VQSDGAGDGRVVSVVIPARNEAGRIGSTVTAVRGMAPGGVRVEVIVVDDGSGDGTVAEAEAAGARVLRRNAPSPNGDPAARAGNPAAARNLGVAASTGDPIVFLDADCVPGNDWLATLLDAHEQGHAAVGGSLALPAGLPFSAQADYYASAYHVHPRRPAGFVPNHPPCNLSVRRATFAGTGGFWEGHPAADGHEELAWQRELQQQGHRIRFEPRAVVEHHNRPGLRNLLRRSYRWAYSAVEAKSRWGAVRFPWLYRSPLALLVLSLPLAAASTAYIAGCWLAAGVPAGLVHLPSILASRVVYSIGLLVGAIRWLAEPGTPLHEHRPRWG